MVFLLRNHKLFTVEQEHEQTLKPKERDVIRDSEKGMVQLMLVCPKKLYG